MYKNKYKNFFWILFSLSIFTTYFFIHATYVSASNISLGIYPPIIQIDARPPTDVQSPITVSNLSTDPVSVQILVRPFTAAPSDNGEPLYLNNPTRLGPDLKIFQKMAIFDGVKNTDVIELAPKQKKNIELRIHLPTGEPPGDYYFSITMLSKPIKTDHTSGAAVAGGISTNVLLTIEPKDQTTGNISEYSTPFFLDHGPVPFTVHVVNTSHHFISPEATILIKNMFGQTIGKVDTLPINILAQTSRFLPSENDTDTKAFWKEKFLLGPYSATLTIALSGEGPIYRRTIYFFAFPIQVLIGIFLGSILVSIVVYRVKKRLG